MKSIFVTYKVAISIFRGFAWCRDIEERKRIGDRRIYVEKVVEIVIEKIIEVVTSVVSKICCACDILSAVAMRFLFWSPGARWLAGNACVRSLTKKSMPPY